MENTLVKITYDYLDKHKTAKGAWTKKQIESLGVNWPPRSGWKQEIVGEFLTQEQARSFEAGKTQHVELKPMKYKKIKKSLESLKPSQLIELKNHIDGLLSKTN